MATATVEADTNDGVTVSKERRRLGLEACWELEASSETLRCMAQGLAAPSGMPTEDLLRLALVVRGMSFRMETLSGVLMSILDDDDTTSNLSRTVLGNRPVEHDQ